ncbi:MAG: hypothetical protein IPJ41_13995 [Phycisphaerales bacterium]|nr:hypothetical protein [Phycisphaerales bacterium]
MNVRLQWVAAAAAMGLGAGVCLAEPTAVFSDGPGNTEGGIFRAVTSANGTFDTFCSEVGEGLTIGFTFEYTISTNILYNGNGTVNPLNGETAFLYTKFVAGEIRGILGNPNMPEDTMADAIQLAIWKIESERNTVDPNALALIAAAQAAIGSGAWSGLGNVRVMNNWDVGHIGEQNHSKQDTLIIVPLPPAAGLAGIGVLGLATGARRRK